MEKYLLIHEGGEILAASEWNDEWQSEVDAGVLEVFEFRDGGYFVRRPFEPGQPNWERI
jgi:hypothetical protein